MLDGLVGTVQGSALDRAGLGGGTGAVVGIVSTHATSAKIGKAAANSTENLIVSPLEKIEKIGTGYYFSQVFVFGVASTNNTSLSTLSQAG